MISFSPLCSFHLYIATFQQHLYMEYISLSYGRHHDLVNRYWIYVYVTNYYGRVLLSS